MGNPRCAKSDDSAMFLRRLVQNLGAYWKSTLFAFSDAARLDLDSCQQLKFKRRKQQASDPRLHNKRASRSRPETLRFAVEMQPQA